jgi:hypothetical protein
MSMSSLRDAVVRDKSIPHVQRVAWPDTDREGWALRRFSVGPALPTASRQVCDKKAGGRCPPYGVA